MNTPRVFHVKSTWKPPFQRLQCGMHMMVGRDHVRYVQDYVKPKCFNSHTLLF